jgi:hypothetical protein
MVVHSYIDNSSNHTPTNTYHRDSPMSGRSPVKNIAFRSLHSSKKKKYCVCGRALVFFKDECWACTECGYTEYLHQPEQQQQIQQQGIGGVMRVDGLNDVQTRPNRGATKFRSKDPRSRFLTKKSEIDDELRVMAEAGGWAIKRFEERIEQSSEVLSSEELRQSK